MIRYKNILLTLEVYISIKEKDYFSVKAEGCSKTTELEANKITVIIPDKTVLQNQKRYRGQFMLIKETISQDDITTLNIYGE